MTQRRRLIINKFVRKELLMTAVLIIGAALIFVGWKLSNSAENKSDITKNTIAFEQTKKTQSSAKLPRRVYKQKIVPLINSYARRNQQAAARALQYIDTSFATFRSRSSKFAGDMTALSTQFGTLKRMAVDKWDYWILGEENTSRLADYTRKMFARDVVSKEQLRSAIQGAIIQYQRDLKANRNTLLSSARIALEQKNLPINFRFDDAGFIRFKKYFDKQLNLALENVSLKSLGINVAVFAGSTAAAIASEQLTSYILSYIGTNLAVDTAAGGTVVTTGAALGGGGGSTLGPAGTVIGITAGLVVGAVTAYFMQAHFEKQIVNKTNSALNKLQIAIVRGTATSKTSAQSQDSWRGLESLFKKTGQTLNNSTKKIMFNSLVKEAA